LCRRAATTTFQQTYWRDSPLPTLPMSNLGHSTQPLQRPLLRSSARAPRRAYRTRISSRSVFLSSLGERLRKGGGGPIRASCANGSRPSLEPGSARRSSSWFGTDSTSKTRDSSSRCSPSRRLRSLFRWRPLSCSEARPGRPSDSPRIFRRLRLHHRRTDVLLLTTRGRSLSSACGRAATGYGYDLCDAGARFRASC
jgi:hypothetical protein